MLEKMKLSTHLLILFLLLEGIALILGVLSLGTIQRLNGRINNLDAEDIPLILAISEVAKEQLNQTLRINEIFLYGEVDNRERFEFANNGFINAGKRLTNVLIEARHITQKGLENPTSTLEKQQLDATKTVLGEYQKIHGSFEHLSGIIIRNQYKYRFLTRAGIITGNKNQTLAEAEANYVKKLGKNISDLDDETKRIENKLKEAFHITKKMVQDLALQSAKERNVAFTIFFLAITIFTVGGFFLTLNVGKIHQRRVTKEKDHQQTLISPFKEKAELLEQITRQLKILIRKAANNNDKQIDWSKASDMALATLITLVSDNARISTETMLLSQESQQKTKYSDESMQAFKELSTRSMALANRIQKGLSHLVQTVMQVKLLATSASAEAMRKNSSQGFIVFTDEIKELAQNSAKAIEVISDLVERDIKEIESRHDKVTSARQMLAEIVESTTRLASDANQIEITSHKQSGLIHKLQEESALIHHSVSNNAQLLHDGGEMCQTLRSYTTLFLTTLDQLVASFDDLHRDEQKVVEDEVVKNEKVPTKTSEKTKTAKEEKG